jgi:hypothetical protein
MTRCDRSSFWSFEWHNIGCSYSYVWIAAVVTLGGAESFIWSGNSLLFIEFQGSLPCSQEPFPPPHWTVSLTNVIQSVLVLSGVVMKHHMMEPAGFTAFYWIPRFVTLFTKICHWTICWSSLIQSILISSDVIMRHRIWWSQQDFPPATKSQGSLPCSQEHPPHWTVSWTNVTKSVLILSGVVMKHRIWWGQENCWANLVLERHSHVGPGKTFENAKKLVPWTRFEPVTSHVSCLDDLHPPSSTRFQAFVLYFST